MRTRCSCTNNQKGINIRQSLFFPHVNTSQKWYMDWKLEFEKSCSLISCIKLSCMLMGAWPWDSVTWSYNKAIFQTCPVIRHDISIMLSCDCQFLFVILFVVFFSSYFFKSEFTPIPKEELEERKKYPYVVKNKYKDINARETGTAADETERSSSGDRLETSQVNSNFFAASLPNLCS